MLEGWKFERIGRDPHVVRITTPNNMVVMVGKEGRTPANVLWMLADAILKDDNGTSETTGN